MGQIKHILMAGLLILIAAMGSGFINLINQAPFLKVSGPGNPGICGNADYTSSDTNTSRSGSLHGQKLFTANCASCHNVFKDGTGPKLGGISSHEKWSDKKELLRWVNNPAVYMQNDTYTQGLKEKFGSVMTAFPNITMEELESIVRYIDTRFER